LQHAKTGLYKAKEIRAQQSIQDQVMHTAYVRQGEYDIVHGIENVALMVGIDEQGVCGIGPEVVNPELLPVPNALV